MKQWLIVVLILICVFAIFVSPGVDLAKSALRAKQAALLLLLAIAVVARKVTNLQFPELVSFAFLQSFASPFYARETCKWTCSRLC